MKKILEKDRKLRLFIIHTENKHKILKSIFKNLNFPALIRWNSFIKFNQLFKNSNKTRLNNKCLYTNNKKRFNKMTRFSRHIFRKLIRSGQIYGMSKSSW